MFHVEPKHRWESGQVRSMFTTGWDVSSHVQTWRWRSHDNTSCTYNTFSREGDSSAKLFTNITWVGSTAHHLNSRTSTTRVLSGLSNSVNGSGDYSLGEPEGNYFPMWGGGLCQTSLIATYTLWYLWWKPIAKAVTWGNRFENRFNCLGTIYCKTKFDF